MRQQNRIILFLLLLSLSSTHPLQSPAKRHSRRRGRPRKRHAPGPRRMRGLFPQDPRRIPSRTAQLRLVALLFRPSSILQQQQQQQQETAPPFVSVGLDRQLLLDRQRPTGIRGGRLQFRFLGRAGRAAQRERVLGADPEGLGLASWIVGLRWRGGGSGPRLGCATDSEDEVGEDYGLEMKKTQKKQRSREI
jgi:hypothetical protein